MTIDSQDLQYFFVEGQRLFNSQQFWHAHEQWEYCWRAAQPPMDGFYQGLIQAAAALVHLQRGNLRGLKRNWYKARPRLLAARAVLQLHDLGHFIYTMDSIVLSNGHYNELPTLDLQHK